MGLYSHIQSNKRKSVALIFGLFLLVFLFTIAINLGLASFSHNGTLAMHIKQAFAQSLAFLPFTLALTGLWVFIGFQFNTRIIASVMSSAPLTRQNNPEIYNLLENLCISRGLPMPMLQLIEDDALNAYASGVNQEQYTITLTRGLINALNKQELEAVIAHELTHIMNGDVRLMVIAMLIAGVISFVGELLMRSNLSIRFSEKEKGAGVLAFFLAVLVSVLSMVIRLALSRSREYLADAGAVELTKNPDAMISALLKISGRSELENAPSSLMEMCIDNDANGLSDIFSTHPSIAKRVQALVETAGGRLPPISSRQPLPEIVHQHPARSKGGEVPVFGGKTPFV